MTQIRFECDRCQQPVEGGYYGNFTANYYDVSDCEHNPWHQFGREGEVLVCDPCVQGMTEYIKIYGGSS